MQRNLLEPKPRHRNHQAEGTDEAKATAAAEARGRAKARMLPARIYKIPYSPPHHHPVPILQPMPPLGGMIWTTRMVGK